MELSDSALVNRVAQSGLMTIKPEEWFPSNKILELDISTYLFQGLLLREKEFRAQMNELDWTVYKDKVLCVFCATDAIVPVWAYMVIAGHTTNIVADLYHGREIDYLKYHFRKVIDHLDTAQYSGQKVVIKGCSNKPIPTSVYQDIAQRLIPVVQKLMFGEACSTVPIFKKKSNET
jgi:hypothetical protein